MQYKHLTQNDKELAICFIGAKLKEYDNEVLKPLVLKLIVETHANCGYKMNEDLIDETIKLFLEDLHSFAGTITFNELEYAFKCGYMYKYGSFTGLNNSTYWKWINTYMQDLGRVKLRKLVIDIMKKSEQKEEITDEKAEKIIKDGIIQMFNNFKNGGEIFDAGGVNYKYLKNKGLLAISDEVKEQIKSRVRAKLTEEAIIKRGSTPIQKAVEEALDITSFKIEVRKEVLKFYFKNLIEIDADINEEIN